ncbi:MAG: hypothetical protein HXX09_13700 [Bacteroidetes bacterium]|nr:hypothetical protein [Bacteroidota bacterium]
MKKKSDSMIDILKQKETSILEIIGAIQKSNYKVINIIGNSNYETLFISSFLKSISKDFSIPIITVENIRKAAFEINKKYFIVTITMSPKYIDYSEFFFNEIEVFLKSEYDIEIPAFTKEETDVKNHFSNILTEIKKVDSNKGLLVFVEDLSNFLRMKDLEGIKKDFQFLNELAQACKEQELFCITAIDFEIYSNPNLFNIPEEAGMNILRILV